ncbi:hypothetical protein OIU77_001666 [Salix suchowensis]|uniref:Malectin-like domain-containing protein n=1 Tax=Salix suchowensis TaxID=1278906 RepID=A0ABQ9B4B5_9ROSI|nr:hypothetical protein OIU77_001666 [Salix suchowensis]
MFIFISLYLLPPLHLFLHVTATEDYLLPYRPTDPILLNCGASSNLSSPDGRSWDDSFYARGNDNPLTYVGFDFPFNLDNTTALETVYRLNVGGQDINSIGDTGMYRTWNPDSEYLSWISWETLHISLALR